ncbi:hypothetical protein [Hyalangium minutum]|uniref:hypothetical protein n=1 Tax=Hyalangium minutum TaxID=394096 RepID=UPI0012F8248A|nr:hypothetical protein [Hyalangium minutum]
MNLAHWWASRWTQVRGLFNSRGSSRTPVSAGSGEPGGESRPGELKETYGRIARIATHARPDEDRRMQLCRCSVCGVVKLCTPDSDFYAQHAWDPLMCQDCFFQLVVDVQCRGVKA